MSFGGMSQSALPTFYQNLKSEILVGTSFDFIICNDFSCFQIILFFFKTNIFYETMLEKWELANGIGMSI